MELEGNSNAGTSGAFLDRLKQRHSGQLNVIWDNAPAHRGEAGREYLRTPGLALWLVTPRFHGGRLCRAIARTSTPMRWNGDMGKAGGDGKQVPGNQGCGAGEGEQLSRRAGQPERGGETAVPDRPASKG